MRIILTCLFVISYIINSWAQLGGCTGPGLPSCQCGTATVICDIQQLNGVTYQMSTYQHPADGPTPMCPGVTNTSSQNPTWYAFPAWCSNLTLQITYTNCSGSGTSRGLQAAVYANCNNLPGSVVPGGCATDWSCIPPPCYGCGVTNGQRILNMTGLTVGATYYLLVDGCGGSACTVNIQITSPPCPQTIGQIPADPAGPTTVCVGIPYNYTGQLPPGATYYYWSVNGDPNGTQLTSNPFTYTFPAPGQYTICLDVANDCVNPGSPPDPRCITVNAFAPNAGTLQANPNPTCPGGTINYSVSGHTTSFTQYLVVTNSSGTIVQVDEGTMGSFTHPQCGVFTLHSFNFQPGALPAPVVGNNISSYACSNPANCCATTTLQLNFQDNQPPMFTNPPPNVTVNCYLNIPPMQDLAWTDNCFPGGTVMGTQSGNITDNCQGGTITRTWTVTDGCGNTATHTQTITVQPVPVATFDGPANMTITCEQIPPPGTLPPLAYTNGLTGDCAITGSIIPTRQDNITNCAGTITYVWQTTDICGRTISHTQVLTVQPPSEATFIDPPASMNVACQDVPGPGVLPPLNYTNGSSGNCLISGTVIPTRVDNISNCSGTITYTWTFTDICGRTTTHQQILNIQPPAEANFNNPPPSATINCVDIPAPGVLPPLSYDNGVAGSCNISGTIVPTRQDNIVNCQGTITYTWQTVDFCNRTIFHQQILTVLPPPVATFTNPPASATINCPDIPPPGTLPPLSYTNGSSGNCLISGSVVPTRQDNIVNCQGTITYTWQFTDPCNRQVTHTQILTVLPPPSATIQNPPASATINCPDIPPTGFLPPLNYDNGLTGSCGISGTLVPTRTDNITNCQGTITFVWQTTDQCNRTISHTQVLTVQPPPAATIQNPPANATINCPDIPPPGTLPPLNYDNGLTGSCGITGTLIPTRTDNITNCQGTITYVWQTTDQCNRTISHTQVLTVLPPPAATIQNPPTSATITCAQIPPPGELPPLNYSNGQTGSCGINGTIIPTRTDNISNCQGTITFQWQTTDQCNRSISHTQVLTLQPPPEANFVNPPQSQTVPCDQAPAPGELPPLNYTNNQTGSCLISGTAIPTRQDNIVNCAGTITFTWTATDPCGRTLTHIQIITVQPPPTATFVNPPVYTAPISCEEAEGLQAPDVIYSNNNAACPINGTLPPVVTKNYNSCGGTIQISWTGNDACGRPLSYNQIITVQKAPPPVFTGNLPADITVGCQDISSFITPLSYSNSGAGLCQISGSLNPQVNQNINVCGGTAVLTWNYSDACNNTLTHTQTITVQPAPQASFVNPPPANITLSCDQVPAAPPSLSYTNGLTGLCAISGVANGIQTGSYNSCGGTIQYTWQFTDACGRSIVHNQTITVSPAANPAFLQSPPDITLPCGVTSYNPPVLNYSNGLGGNCAINGNATATLVNFGTYRVYTWTYTNPCNGFTITEEQFVYLSQTPNISLNPTSTLICQGQSYNLNQVIVTDANGGPINLTYHSGTPAGPSNILPSSLVSPAVTTTYYILATNNFGCTDQRAFTVNVTPNVNSGNPVDKLVCNDGNPINLWSFLSGNYDTNGFWTDVNGLGVNLNNPASVFFIGFPPGNYPFDYTVPPANPVCPPATTRIIVQLINPGTYEVTNVECNASFTSYTIFLTINNLTVQSNFGNVVVTGPNTIEIRNIPISQTAVLTLTTSGTECDPLVFPVSPPNCSCPAISPPTTGTPPKVCQGQPNLTLSVNPGAGFTANWYSAPTGGTVLLNNSNTYTPTVTAPGIYNFWADREDLVTNCKSNTRVLVTFEIVANPVVSNATLTSCDGNNDGFATFNLSNAKSQITGNPGHDVKYYATLANAQSETDTLAHTFTNTTLNTQVIYAVVKNNNGCKSQAEVILNVLPSPAINLTVNPETCLGDGDGSITVQVNNGFSPYEYSLDNTNWSSNATIDNLNPGNFTVYVRNANQCVNSLPTTIAAGQRMDIQAFVQNCSNNGTPSNGADDIYTFNFTLQSTIAVMNGFTVSINGSNIGTYNYNTPSSFTLPADGNSYSIVFTDAVTGCSVSRTTTPLSTCSTDCLIEVNGLNVACDDNGTESEGNDDFYTISFSTNVFNGGPSGTYNILVNNVIIASHPYGTSVSFNLPANGTTPVVVIRDQDNLICQTTLAVPALNACSNKCSISATVTNILCNDAGTINDPADDTFSFTIRVTGQNTSGGWRIQGQPQVRNYNSNINLGPFPISGGNLSLIIVDNADPDCTASVNVTAPPPCSEPCVLRLNDLEISACNNGGTGNTTADDRFSVSFRITITSGSASVYRISDGTNQWGPFIYGNTVSIQGLPANGSNITLSVQDQSNPGCNFSFVVSQNPCSVCNQTVSAGPDIELSCLVNTANLVGTSSEPGVIYQWTGPGNFVRNGLTATTAVPGRYYFTVTFADQCVARDSMEVTIDANLPLANAGPDKDITCLVSEVTLTGSTNIAPANASYAWTDAQGNLLATTLNLTVNTPGTYFFRVTNTTNNCVSGNDEAVVFDRRNKPIAVIYADPGNLLDCVVSSIVLSGQPQDNVFFNWIVGEINYTKVASIVVNQEGLVTMIAIDSITGCSETNQLQIIDLQDYPILIVDPVAPITCDDNSTTISAANSPGGPNLVFTWLDGNNNVIQGATSNQLTVTIPGTYYVILTDTTNKCRNVDTIVVESLGDFPQFTSTGDVNLFCGVNQATLQINIQNPNPNTSINWSTQNGAILSGTGTASVNVQGSGIYRVEVTFTDSGCRTTRDIRVNVNDAKPESLIVIANDETCAGSRDASISVFEVTGGTPPYTYRINNQNPVNNPNFTSLSPGNYSLLVTDANGCTINQNFTLARGNDVQIDLDGFIEIRRGDSLILEANVNIPASEIFSIKWTPADNLSCDTCLITTFTGTRDAEYEVLIIDKNGCESRARIRISVKGLIIITVPNILSPQSGSNNKFVISANQGVERIEKLRIFDRWGNLIFISDNFPPNDPNYAWDGKFKGNEVTPGVYVYIIEYKTVDGIEILTGDVSVIR